MPLHLIRQDITELSVDAIVNTTNPEMVGYSGVDLAVHTKAGVGMDKECARIAPLKTGTAKITSGYGLKCKYVIHTACSPMRADSNTEYDVLRSCYLESLRAAVKKKCRTVAFPLIGTGEYNYPKQHALQLALQVITDFLLSNEITVYICVYDSDSYCISKKLFDDIKQFISDDNVEKQKASLKRKADFSRLRQSRSLFTSIAESDTCRPESSSLDREDDESLNEYLKRMDKGFRDTLFELIDKSGMSDVECYKKANVDKRTFSKIKSSSSYRPSKQTAIAFAIALQLDIDAAQKLLSTLGYTLSGASVFDRIICFFIQKGEYDIFTINEALFEFDQVLLGSV